MTVNEVCKITGVSIRTLHHYDETGLLVPAVTTEASSLRGGMLSFATVQQTLIL